MELIRLEDIHKTYYLGEVDVPVLRGISLSIHRGELVALMGASGSGKTTLMNILGCLDHPTSGRYWLDGEELSRVTPNQRALVRSQKLGFVFQSFNLLPRTSALQNVLMPLDYAIRRPHAAEARRYAQSLLESVGLTDRMDHEPSQMSGGQQQRVAIGRSLINRPTLLLADEPTGNLDSHTSVEILRMFQQLNAEGITVILVTHDPSVAAYAHRVIRIADGLVEGDEVNSSPIVRDHATCPTTPPLYPAAGGNGDGNGCGHGDGIAVAAVAERETATVGLATCEAESSVRCETANNDPCKTTCAAPRQTVPAAAPRHCGHAPAGRARLSLLPTTFRTALGALYRNKMRSALSALGVIIAVGAVIAMTEIGQGSKVTLQKGIASMGANTLMIMSGAAASGGVTMGSGSVMTLTPQDAEEVAKQCPAVLAAAPSVRARAQIVCGHRNWVPNEITGTTPAYLSIRDWGDMTDGAMFTDRDVRNCNKVCVIGTTIRKELFGGESPVGKEIRINNIPFRVLGVLSKKGANMMGHDQDDVVLAPWTTIKYRVSGSALTQTNQSTSAGTSSSSASIDDLYPVAEEKYISRTTTETTNTPQPIRFDNVNVIHVKARSADEVQSAISQITELLHDRHRIQDGEADDFNIRDMAEMSRILSSSTETMSSLLLVVAMISLVVGGVGIMNIMLVSVTERTREIGLRMAVGARSHHILRQFLVEAISLCLVGGAIGILLGRGMSILVRWWMRWPTEISLPVIVAAVAVSVMVGVVFGFYPAWKASRLDPIEALRYE